VIVALLLSLFIHAGGWSAYEAGKKLGVWDRLHALLPVKHPAPKNPAVLQPVDAQEPQIYVDVTHPDTEAPQKTIYYSDKNSRAANPDATVDSNQPKLDGLQKDVPKTEDTPRLTKLQPSPSEAPAQPQSQPQPPPSSPYNLGDVNLSKSQNTNQITDKPTPPTTPRPRTIQEAMRQMHPDQLPGRQMQQKGGVRRQQLWSSLDAKATPFGDYDRAIIEAVQQRWYDLLDSRRFALDRTGRVSLHFRLKADGSVDELSFLANDAGTTLGYVCEESIMEAAPFAKWPPDMRRMIGEDYRDITFTFYYY